MPGKSNENLMYDANGGHIEKSLAPLPGNGGESTGRGLFYGHIQEKFALLPVCINFDY